MIRKPNEIEESDKEEIAFSWDSHCYTFENIHLKIEMIIDRSNDYF